MQYNEEKKQSTKEEKLYPNVDLGLKVTVVASDGNFVLYWACDKMQKLVMQL